MVLPYIFRLEKGMKTAAFGILLLRIRIRFVYKSSADYLFCLVDIPAVDMHPPLRVVCLPPEILRDPQLIEYTLGGE